jgi:hypothetical protein
MADADTSSTDIKPSLETGSPPTSDPAKTPDTAGSGWRYLPPPLNVPDVHTEYDARDGTSLEGFGIVGVRVRGKKHKHEGTHCDDWFEFAVVGPWTVLALSDGGGSYAFSRLGARTACKAALEAMAGRMAECRIRDRTSWSKESFLDDDLMQVKDALVNAFGTAWLTIRQVVVANATNPSYTTIIDRELTERDLNCTLLIAVHTTLTFDGVPASLVFSCAVGDGMVAVIDKNGEARLLMTPDSGDYSGQVRFLDEREIAPLSLANKVFPFLGPIRALMLMSDGVADDYFPNDLGMVRLYGDLILNGVIPVADLSPSKVIAALQATKATNLADLAQCDIGCLGETPTAGGIERPRLLSITAYSEVLGLKAEDAAKNVTLMAAAVQAGLVPATTSPKDGLQTWLDAYHVRGSFDDRTLVVLYNDESKSQRSAGTAT